MSAREWKPGDVAMVTWKALGQWRTDLRFRTADDRPPRWIGTDGSWIGDVTAKEARPLVLVDPEDREAVEQLADELVGVGAHKGGCGWDLVQAALREFANPTPPKPEEPTGLGAVVEDRDGIRWVRSLRADVEFSTPWRDCNDDHFARHYDAIAAVRVLSEGIQ